MVSLDERSERGTVTLLLITLTRGPLGHLVFSRAREVKYANNTSSLNSEATVKPTFSSYIGASRKFFLAIIVYQRSSIIDFGKKLENRKWKACKKRRLEE